MSVEENMELSLVYALVMTLANGQSLIAQTNLSSKECTNHIVAIDDVKKSMLGTVSWTGEYQTGSPRPKIIEVESPKYECHPIGKKR